MAQDIGEGRWREYGKQAVFTYCEEDVRKSSELFRRQVTGYEDIAPIDVARVLRWSEYSAKAVSRIQARGMPIDMPLWNFVQEHKGAVIAALIRRYDPSHIDGCPGAYLHDRRRMVRRPIRAMAGPCRHSGLAAIGLWSPSDRR